MTDTARAALRDWDLLMSADFGPELTRHRQELHTVPGTEAARVCAILDATLALLDAYDNWTGTMGREERLREGEPLEEALRVAASTHDAATPSTTLYERITNLLYLRRPGVVAANECPRHRRNAVFIRTADGGYDWSVPRCRGDDCIHGRCDTIRQMLRRYNCTPEDDDDVPAGAWLYALRDELQDVVTEDIDDVPRLLLTLNRTIALYEAFRAWEAAGEDTPHTREPLELALRAASPDTALYRRICQHLDRPVDAAVELSG